MRRVRYQVAASLDGYIAGPNGEDDWIPMDPEIDFAAIFSQFDTFLMGRRTYEPMATSGRALSPGARTVVVSRTLRPEDHPGVTILAEGVAEAVQRLRAEEGKDIWLFGGGALFASLSALGLVDTVEVALVPVLLGGGIPLFPPVGHRVALTLTSQRVYRASGIVLLEYAVGAAPKPRRPRKKNDRGRRS